MRKNLIKFIAFVLVCAVVFWGVISVICKPKNPYSMQLVKNFYAEREESLDAVYIGGSNVFMYWQPPLAWARYGIAVGNFASDNQPLAAAEFLIREGRKTQPNALYIVSLSGFRAEISAPWIHMLTDFMPNSENKRLLINRLCDLADIDAKDRDEFYFPLLRYHSRWCELRPYDFQLRLNGMKGAVADKYNLQTILDVTGRGAVSQKRCELTLDEKEVVESLLVYCDAEQVNVLFVAAPVLFDEVFQGKLNTISDMISAHGYSVLDMTKTIDEIGLDRTCDYYNAGHTNIHGCIKTMAYTAQYLINHYGFKNKRGDPDYRDWDAAYEKYVGQIARYTLPFEYEMAPRDYTLATPEIAKADKTGLVRWNAVDGVDGYGIFVQGQNGIWKQQKLVNGNTLSWQLDTDQIMNRVLVVGYSSRDGVLQWGNYDVPSIIQ